MNKILVAQTCAMEKLKALFIELTSKNCNLNCKHCYIQTNKKIDKNDFLSFDTIKEALESNATKSLENIYLTGGEPLLHPQFNKILRLCLTKTNTTIMTNGICINDKKARFFSKVEDECDYTNLSFHVSIDHFEEMKNDAIRGRGSFRKSVHAVISLYKYDFNPIVKCVNYYDEDENYLTQNFLNLFNKYDIKLTSENFSYIPYYSSDLQAPNIDDFNSFDNIDCRFSRILTTNGIYNCNFLANDYRARSGANLNEFSTKCHLESECCSLCIKKNRTFFMT